MTDRQIVWMALLCSAGGAWLAMLAVTVAIGNPAWAIGGLIYAAACVVFVLVRMHMVER